jgi:hypothetical protein
MTNNTINFTEFVYPFFAETTFTYRGPGIHPLYTLDIDLALLNKAEPKEPDNLHEIYCRQLFK